MVDIDPYRTMANHTPRDSNLVDAVAEAQRIATQLMRSNPLEDAYITNGVTKWKGNYGGDLLWVGEFFPADQNLMDPYGNLMPQRGFSLVRDDPQGNSAFAMYDWNPQPGVPLRQKIVFHDADHRVMMREGANGGRSFPDKAVPMYARIGIDTPGGAATTPEIAWSGSANIVGTHIDFQAGWAAGAGPPTVSAFVRVTGIDGTVINSPTIVQAGAAAFGQMIDITGIYAVADFVNVDWFVWRSAGTGNYFPRVTRCRSFSS